LKKCPVCQKGLKKPSATNAVGQESFGASCFSGAHAINARVKVRSSDARITRSSPYISSEIHLLGPKETAPYVEEVDLT